MTICLHNQLFVYIDSSTAVNISADCLYSQLFVYIIQLFIIIYILYFIHRMMEEEEKSLMWGNMASQPPPQQPPPMMMRRPDSSDDRHVIAKHGLIYPTEEQLASIQKQVSIVEKGLKAVSDGLEGEVKLKGVMRVGPLAKGLLLRSDEVVDLVLLASDVPTLALLEAVASNLQSHLSDTYQVTCNEDQARIEVKTSINVHIGLTSASVRSSEVTSEAAKIPENALNREKCLQYLADIRRAKWFTARAAGLQSSVIILRILRDLQNWRPQWRPLNPFALELIVEKSLASVGLPLSPGDGVRRVFEAVSAGCLLPGSPGLLDPCEKEAKDVLDNLSPQEREDMTSDAQNSLRLIAFRQIHQVLHMEPLPINKFGPKPRKRPAASTASEAVNGESSSKVAKES